MDAFDGLSALFSSRREVDLAVEHLVQEHGIERGAIFLEPVGEAGSTGIRTAGADEASGAPGTERRTDAPLHGEIRLTVAAKDGDRMVLDRALHEAGGQQIRRIS